MGTNDYSNSRRRFLSQSTQIALGSAAAWATMGQMSLVQAATRPRADDFRAMVCIYLFGGNDSFNMLVPRTLSAYSNYQAARPSLAIAQNTLLPLNALSGGAGVEWGLHPAMGELQALFNTGKAGLLANVGPLAAPTTKANYQARSVPLPPELFSHVDQQAYSLSMGSETAAKTGWGAKIADRLGDYGLVSNGGLPASISLSGSNMWQAGAADGIYTMGNTGPTRINDTLRDSTWTRTIPRREAFYKLLDAAQRDASAFTREHARTSKRAIEFSEFTYNAINNAPALATPFPATSSNRLSDPLRTVARTIAARQALGQKRQVFFVGLGGWDTHDNLVVDHERLLKTLSDATAAFYRATVEMGVSEQVTAFTLSDFGRTLNNNGDGSDHGWGGHSWVIGGDVVGQRIYGQPAEMRLGSDLDVGRGRMIPTTAIEQLGSTMARWFGLRYGDAMEIFPNLRNFGSGADYLPMLASTNRLLNEVDFDRRLIGGK